jgi:GNAT superfamily N-acetyltransferase
MPDSDSTPIKIRYAASVDNVLLAELGRQTFSDSFAADNTPEDMAAYLAASFSPQIQAAELADPNTVFLIAEAAGKTVGFARMKESLPLPGITGARTIEIVRFYSIKARIGRGVGAALMQACLDEASRRGCDSIWLDVWKHNPRAIAFYHKWGFVEVGTAIFKLGDDLQHDLLLQKSLRPEI